MNVDVRNLYDAQNQQQGFECCKKTQGWSLSTDIDQQQPTNLSRGQIVNEAKPVAEVRPHCAPLSPALSQPDQRVNVSCDQDSGF